MANEDKKKALDAAISKLEKDFGKGAVWASFACGVGITVSNMFMKYIASPINAGAVAMIAGLIIVPIVSLVTPKMKKEKMDEMFACYEEEIVITKKHSLETKK